MAPSQGVAMVLRQTKLGGARSGYCSVLGNTAGPVTWSSASAIGRSQVIAHSRLAHPLLQYVDVA